MKLPPYGFCVPCQWVNNRDGDTVTVKLRTGQQCAIRLIDCWAPELNQPGGKKAAEFLTALLEGADEELSVFVPLAKDRDKDGVVSVMEILKGLSFDRVPAHLFLGTEDVSGLMVKAGHASKSRP